MNEPIFVTDRGVMDRHPCFSLKAHGKFGRIHLPVAPVCNTQCRYCVRKYDCANESRPGITSRVLSSSEAVERVGILLDRNRTISVIGIAGPGDPLANDSTFETLSGIRREFPDIILCLSTNGLMLTDRLEEIVRCGVTSLTITINAITTEVAEKIYGRAHYRGVDYFGREAAELMVRNQQRGLLNAIDAGLIVKVNTVYIPGVNDAEIPLIAWRAGAIGADLMNILPLIPNGEFSGLSRPTHDMLKRMRAECGRHVPQMTHCRQCRADAFGALGQDGDAELEILNARIGDEYCEMV